MSRESIELEEKAWWEIIRLIENESERILEKCTNNDYCNVSDFRRKKDLERLEIIVRTKFAIESRIDP